MITANKSQPWGNAIMSGLVAGVVMGLSVLYGGKLGYFAWMVCWIILFSWLRPFSKQIVAILISVMLGVLISNVPLMLSTESAVQINTGATLESHDGTMSIKVALQGDPNGYDYIMRVTKSTEYTDWYEQESVTSEDLADGREVRWFPMSIPGNSGETEPSSVNDVRVEVEVIEKTTGLPIYTNYLWPQPDEVQVIPITNAQSNDTELGGIWPTTSHDMQRSGRSPCVGPVQPFLAWEGPAGAWGEPFISEDGTVYFTGYNLFVVSPDGTLKWAFKEVVKKIAIGRDGTMYFGSSDSCVFAVSPEGVLKWKFPTDGDGYYFSPAIGSDETIYVATADFSGQDPNVSQLYAIAPDGSLKWELNIEGQIGSSPAIGDNDTILFTCLNTLSGDSASPMSGKLYAINPDSTLKWTCSLNNRGNLAITENGITYVKSWGILFAVNPDGSIKWENHNIDTGFGSLAVDVDGTAYVGADDGKLYAISADGQLKWSFATGLSSVPPPAIDSNGTIYLATGEDIYALNSDGNLKWKFSVGELQQYGIAIGTDGYIYTGSGQAICSKP